MPDCSTACHPAARSGQPRPDPYGKQIDGLGNATSSTSKTVILSPSTRPGHDVDYLFGQVSID